jgi:hypothetical protein
MDFWARVVESRLGNETDMFVRDLKAAGGVGAPLMGGNVEVLWRGSRGGQSAANGTKGGIRGRRADYGKNEATVRLVVSDRPCRNVHGRKDGGYREGSKERKGWISDRD